MAWHGLGRIFKENWIRDCERTPLHVLNQRQIWNRPAPHMKGKIILQNAKSLIDNAKRATSPLIRALIGSERSSSPVAIRSGKIGKSKNNLMIQNLMISLFPFNFFYCLFYFLLLALRNCCSFCTTTAAAASSPDDGSQHSIAFPHYLFTWI